MMMTLMMIFRVCKTNEMCMLIQCVNSSDVIMHLKGTVPESFKKKQCAKFEISFLFLISGGKKLLFKEIWI